MITKSEVEALKRGEIELTEWHGIQLIQLVETMAEGLTSIAFNDEPDAIIPEYWECAKDKNEVLANDTKIARSILKAYENGGKDE